MWLYAQPFLRFCFETPGDGGSGQGDGGTGTGIFDSYLQNVPEEGRAQVMAYLKDAEKNVNGRLEEASKFKSQWEPYQQVEALSEYKPNELAELLQWHQFVKQEDGYKQFVEQAAKELGLTPAQEEKVEEELGELTPQQIQQLVAQEASQHFAPLQEKFAELETEKAIDTEDQNIRGELQRLEDENKMTFTKDQKAIILDLGMNQEGPGWVQAGFDRFKSMTAEAQRAFVNDKNAQGTQTITTGGQSQMKPSLTFDEAAARTRERLRQAQS